MILKAIILSVFVGCTMANIPDTLLAKAVVPAANPCVGLHNFFATNTRGCSWYHVCVDEVSVNQARCPEGHQFNFANQNCPPKGTVECTLDRVVEPVCPSGNDQGVSLVPHPYSCSKFIICFDGVENDRDCEAGLHYSHYDQKCVSPFLADCDIEANACSESVQSGRPVLLPNSRNCRSYFACIGDRNMELFCPPNTHFEPSLGWCEDPEYVDCTPVKPPGQPTIPDKVTIDCGGLSGISVAHPDSCEFYFFCAADVSFLQVCGDGLIFDFVSRRCQTREEGTCFKDTQGTTEAPIETDPPTEAPIETNPPTTLEPEETTVEPEETTVEPEETTVEPEETTVEPEETTVEPEETTVEPEETTVEPEETTVEPEETAIDESGVPARFQFVKFFM